MTHARLRGFLGYRPCRSNEARAYQRDGESTSKRGRRNPGGSVLCSGLPGRTTSMADGTVNKGRMLYDEQHQVWVLVLNTYQRDNLLWLLNMIGYGKPENTLIAPNDPNWTITPFHLLNTGDWVGEVAQKLGEFDSERPGLYKEERDALGKRKARNPNKTAKELMHDFKAWLDHKLLDMMASRVVRVTEDPEEEE